MWLHQQLPFTPPRPSSYVTSVCLPLLQVDVSLLSGPASERNLHGRKERKAKCWYVQEIVRLYSKQWESFAYRTHCGRLAHYCWCCRCTLFNPPVVYFRFWTGKAVTPPSKSQFMEFTDDRFVTDLYVVCCRFLGPLLTCFASLFAPVLPTPHRNK